MVFPLENCPYDKNQTLYHGQQYLQPHPMSYSTVLIIVQSLRPLFCFSKTQSPFCFLNSCSFAWNVQSLPLGMATSLTNWNFTGYWEPPCPMSLSSAGMAFVQFIERGVYRPNFAQLEATLKGHLSLPTGWAEAFVETVTTPLPTPPNPASFPSTQVGISTSESAFEGIQTLTGRQTYHRLIPLFKHLIFF